VTYLNESWRSSEGGQLVLYHKEGEKEILPEGGRSVFFKSDEIEHEVKPAKRYRMSITGWLKI
jgi:SM-20-related protein